MMVLLLRLTAHAGGELFYGADEDDRFVKFMSRLAEEAQSMPSRSREKKRMEWLDDCLRKWHEEEGGSLTSVRKLVRRHRQAKSRHLIKNSCACQAPGYFVLANASGQ